MDRPARLADGPLGAGHAADRPPADETAALLDRVHRTAYGYFDALWDEATGLVPDSTLPESPASIAGVGFGLAALPGAVERGWAARGRARRIALAAARFFRDAPQDGARDGVGYRGFYYHFLRMDTGRRAWRCELSTIDTTFLVAGLLTAAAYFEADGPDGAELAAAARAVYERVDWAWALDGGETVSMGWTPERGMLRHRWQGYNEALLLYALAAGSPTYPVPPEAHAAFTRTYRWKTLYGQAHVYAGPLFVHQYSHLWVDLRGRPDAYMAARGLDYAENTRRATWVHREYARRNPRGFAGYGADDGAWGLSACDGPGPATHTVGGRTRRFWGYRARGAPHGPDDGTLAPWAALASLPFAPDVVLPGLAALARRLDAREGPDAAPRPSFERAHNPTFPAPVPHAPRGGWHSPVRFALNEGPVVLAFENFRSGLVWRLMDACPALARGLHRNGFHGVAPL